MCGQRDMDEVTRQLQIMKRRIKGNRSTRKKGFEKRDSLTRYRTTDTGSSGAVLRFAFSTLPKSATASVRKQPSSSARWTNPQLSQPRYVSMKLRTPDIPLLSSTYPSALERDTNTPQIMGVKSKGITVPTFSTNGGDDSGHKERIWTDEERKKMRTAIQNASSLAEIARLEKDFAEGRMPAHLVDDVEMGQT
jgi:hypothetical protein